MWTDVMIFSKEQGQFVKGLVLIAVVLTFSSILSGFIADVLRAFNLLVTILYISFIFLVILTALTALLALTYIFMKNHELILTKKPEDK